MSKLKNGAKSLFNIAKNAAKGIDQSVPEEVAKDRLDTCLKCPNLGALDRCKVCGCFVRAKVKFKQELCPEFKWKAWEPK